MVQVTPNPNPVMLTHICLYCTVGEQNRIEVTDILLSIDRHFIEDSVDGPPDGLSVLLHEDDLSKDGERF